MLWPGSGCGGECSQGEPDTDCQVPTCQYKRPCKPIGELLVIKVNLTPEEVRKADCTAPEGAHLWSHRRDRVELLCST
jgi:hypothetical protein